MRAWCLFLVAPLIARAQFPAPQQPGTLLERDLNADSGELAIRAPDYQVYRYRFDPKTVAHRDTFAGGMGHLRLGDQVTVESDPVAGSLVRYARTIWVSDSPSAMSEADPLRRSLAFPLLDLGPHTGTLTFAGVVSRLNSQSLVLRTRDGEQTLLIRHDTRYVANGDTVEAAKLQPNMRVFVRAGRNLYEQVEAYQVIWGSILVPARR